ncbi:unnamed protein product [Dracunculus medinensis]|uniref:DUF4200 domain-containing protein n=1 Tax=Dracunculus medinensis TaxID=318479 RepID=A0A158Q630_DRAME|nr:unnamed protein product [Dracunculus medinensis]
MEKSIHRLEKKNVLKKYESKMIFADGIKKTLDQLEATFKELKKHTEKEKADVENIEQPSVRNFLKQQGTWNDRFDKEQKDYLDALNKQELAEKEMAGAKKQYEKATHIADIYKKHCDTLHELYDKQDRLLSSIFGNDYASEKENRMENELEEIIEWQQRVSLAKFKWTNARVLLVHACTQMAFGIARWKQLNNIDAMNTRMRYFAAAEARNNFIAAGQNVQSCRIYLGKVQFPYCTKEEMFAMEEALNNAFNDIETDETLNDALSVYETTHKKLASLIQWFDKVITETILKDLDKANKEITKKRKQIRTERLAFMKKKVKEEFGYELKIIHDKDDELDKELLILEKDEAEDQSEIHGKNLSVFTSIKINIDISEGDVKQKLDEYGSTRKEMEKRNTLQREKQEMALQEKLKLRAKTGKKSRKQRKQDVTTGIQSQTEIMIVDEEQLSS